MKYKIFESKTGLRVSELALETGTFGARWGYGSQPDEAKKNMSNDLFYNKFKSGNTECLYV